MCATKKKPLCFAVPMKLLSAENVIVESTMQTSLPANTLASLFFALLSKNPRSVISARANENTQKHNRFLLTGVKLTPSTSPLPLNPTSSSSNGYNAATIVSETKSSSSQSSKRFRFEVSNNENSGSPSIDKPLASSSTTYRVEDNASISTSSVSGYLMEDLPGWHLDDFPEPPSGGANGFCKTFNQLLPAKGGGFENNMAFLSSSEVSYPRISVFIAGEGEYPYGCLFNPFVIRSMYCSFFALFIQPFSLLM
ncbi:hypothetical protein V6N13_106011 [Hibiscus sabdariffa]|uniref:Uncharacterized protein n=1 Tax=Hibiscus sabdariffa TaxID=183260 RepID=A0ABR2EZE4_9ROSI